MIDLSLYISELLYLHDYVILPGLGGFILHEKEGNYSPSSHQFVPPSREVSFNGLLKNDDGLLISYICDKETISYPEARAIVTRYVGHLVENAGTQQGSRIEKVGRLYFSQEGKLIFSPDREVNYLRSSYGLAPVIVSPKSDYRAPRSHERTLKTRTDRRIRPVKAKTPGSVKWTLAVSLPVILFLLWGIIFPASFQHYYLGYSGFFSNLFRSGSSFSTKPILPNNIPDKTLQMVIHPMARIEGSLQILYSGLRENQVTEAKNLTPRVIDSEMPEAEQINQYHVIGGVFREKENAERYLEALSALGHHASLAGTNRRGFYRVSYESFASWNEAAVCLKTIKAKENPSAWILKY